MVLERYLERFAVKSDDLTGFRILYLDIEDSQNYAPQYTSILISSFSTVTSGQTYVALMKLLVVSIFQLIFVNGIIFTSKSTSLGFLYIE